MRKLFKNLPVALITFALMASCGKEGSSGSSSSSNSNVSDTVTTTSTDIRDAIEAKSMAAGAPAGTTIYHWGYDSDSSSESENCESYDLWIINPTVCWGGSVNTGTNSTRIIKVVDPAVDSVTYSQASGNDSYGNLVFGDALAAPFDRGSETYTAMLGLDETPLAVKISSATISFQGTSKSAKLVEYFYGEKDYITGRKIYSSVKRYVLSTSVPVIANPVVSFGNGFNVTSRLMKINNSQVTGVKLTKYHTIEYKSELVDGYYQQTTVLKAVSGTINI